MKTASSITLILATSAQAASSLRGKVQSSLLQQDECFCTREYEPVCAVLPTSGGERLEKTFDNACLAGCVGGSAIVYQGQCVIKPTLCSSEYTPVCAVLPTSGGERLEKTFDNACLANQVGGSAIIHQGECIKNPAEPVEGECFCNSEHKPVCAVLPTSGGERLEKTFYNACFANCVGGSAIVYQGECTTTTTFNCNTREVFSEEKKKYCCEKEKIGCSTFEEPNFNFNPKDDDCRDKGRGDRCDMPNGNKGRCTGNGKRARCVKNLNEEPAFGVDDDDCRDKGRGDRCDMPNGNKGRCTGNGKRARCVRNLNEEPPTKVCDYVCPSFSVPKSGRKCYDNFGDCTCLKNDYVCPSNSVPKSGRKCYDTFADCKCRTGYVKDHHNERCVKNRW